MIDQFAAVLIKKLKDDLDNRSNDLLSGRCRSFDEYRYECGVLRGMYMAKEYIEDLAKKAEEAE